MESVGVTIEVTGWSESIRKAWAASAPNTLAALHETDAFFSTVDDELTTEYLRRTRNLGATLDASAVLEQYAAGVPFEQWAAQSLTEQRRVANALLTDFLLFDPRGHDARVEELSNLARTLPSHDEFARVISIATLEPGLVAWALHNANADASDESVQIAARRELAEIYALHPLDAPLTGLTRPQVSTRLFLFRQVQQTYAQACAQVPAFLRGPGLPH